MNDNDTPDSLPLRYLRPDIPQDERELSEWLQREQDEIARDLAHDRLWVGLALLGVIVAAVLALNWWLPVLGYGA